MEENLYHEMYQLETAHWWFRAKHRIVSHLIDVCAPRRNHLRILDLGCGTGAMLAFLEQRGEVTGMDSAPEAIAYAGKRTRAHLMEGYLPGDLDRLPKNGFDCVLMLDLLEHLEEDGATLRGALELLAEDGVVVVTVPAYQWLYSPRDTYHHHLRRYGARQLRNLLEESGYRIELFSHYNAVLFPPALASRLVDKVKKEEPGPDLSLPSPLLNRVLEEAFASERFLLPHLSFPFGLSLIAVAGAR